jgi:hypothetical protein
MITLLVTLRELPSFNHRTVMPVDYTVPRADGGNTLIYIQRNTRLLRLHYNLSLNVTTTKSVRFQTARSLSPQLDPTLSRTDFNSESFLTKYYYSSHFNIPGKPREGKICIAYTFIHLGSNVYGW